ncbi:radical SAM protein [Gloeocapsa sp. PCC 73106]|uniref:radical SAM protein n=1 Tax=Gloeocapsa sp. PCC 73106 TaxID=102232 RepID=UPI0002ABD14E|nr:radical SAM protein [Gloeocapsa sp. PCC 73106]ELR99205.1 biotin synthase-like enzyme [Gloeocapsa sp. PCC 73106]
MKIFSSEEFTDIEYLTKREIVELLRAEGQLQKSLFNRAKAIRSEVGIDTVKLRGIIKIAGYGEDLEKYYLNRQAILAIAKQIKAAHLDTVMLECGQNEDCNSTLEEIIPILKNDLKLRVVLALGERSKEDYKKYAELGVDSYLLKFQTSDPILAENVLQTPLKRRLRCLNFLQQLEFKVETGNFIGLPGQTLENIAEDILLTMEINPTLISCSPFITNESSPEQINLVLNTMAIYRLALKKSSIVAVNDLEKLKPEGQLMGLNAGANLLNINFTPAKFGQQYAIHSHQRFIISLEHALNTINRAGSSS